MFYSAFEAIPPHIAHVERTRTMATPPETPLRDYPMPVWGPSEEGLCANCSAKCKRYGSGANPLCRDCFVKRAAKWGPGVRQKGYNA